jgi:hypothetical protein
MILKRAETLNPSREGKDRDTGDATRLGLGETRCPRKSLTKHQVLSPVSVPHCKENLPQY